MVAMWRSGAVSSLPAETREQNARRIARARGADIVRMSVNLPSSDGMTPVRPKAVRPRYVIHDVMTSRHDVTSVSRHLTSGL